MVKKILALVIVLASMAPGLVFAASTNGQGTTNDNAASASTGSATSTSQAVVQGSGTAAQTGVQAQNQVQTQTSNPGTGTMTQSQIQAEEQLQLEIQQSAPLYEPKSSMGMEKRSAVANAAEQLIRTASQMENKGIGDQIRAVAQTQVKNQDKIGESIDKAESRSSFAKFFIGANFDELKNAKSALSENQAQIQELQQIMAQLSTDAEKVAIADQIIALQRVQLELKDQMGELSSGFSLFGWLNRWYNNY